MVAQLPPDADRLAIDRGTGRRGFTVALIGPDGSGKTTVAGRLVQELPLPIVRLYMSINPASSGRMLPTTWLSWVLRGRPEHIADVRRVHSHRLVSVLATLAELANRIAEEAYRVLLARWYVALGRVVVFDRHYYFDYHAMDVAGGSPRWEDRVHGAFLRRISRPDLTVYLDAPPAVLLARKGEGTLQSLTAVRGELLAAVAEEPRSVVLDGTAPLDDVVRSVAAAVQDLARRRASGTQPAVRARLRRIARADRRASSPTSERSS